GEGLRDLKRLATLTLRASPLAVAPPSPRGRGYMKKRLGQHFLTDPSILRRVVQFAHLDPEDTVVEIGPGAGSLTLALAAVVHRVIAIEIDRDFIVLLRARVASNVEIFEVDVVEVAFPSR